MEKDFGISEHGYTIEELKGQKFNGIYFPNCGYFVDTRGRYIEQINNTEYHEACHALIQQDSEEHFCETT